ncbi:hypothetical protein GCM10010207_70680 [Streptomyces atratus]|nr:hypothetical protein GCM10010207_70680 [Streptomyces atratus]
MDTFMSSAMGGNSPESMNSLVPRAKTERPRMYTARGMRERRAAESGMTAANSHHGHYIPGPLHPPAGFRPPLCRELLSG